MYSKQVSYAATLPISRAEAKNFCRVPDVVTNDDALLDLLIASAVTHAENITGLSLSSKNYVLYVDEFPSTPLGEGAFAPLFGAFSFFYGSRFVTQSDRLPFTIPLRHSPVTAVSKIVYIDLSGNEVTLLPGQDFSVDLGSEPARVNPLPGGRWPIGKLALSAVQVFYTAGYQPDPAAINDTLIPNLPTPPNQTPEYIFVIGIPADIKVAMLMLIADAYANREPSVSGAVGRVSTCNDILIANKTWNFS